MILYILASIVSLVYGTKYLYSTGQTRGVIFAIGTLIVLVYFGFRWFGSRIEKPKNWPPIINMCPDYLTYLPNLPGCVDMLGVTNNGAGLQKTNPSDINSIQLTNTQKVFQYTSKDVKNAKLASELQLICDRCRAAGVTWEGVYDGDVCVGISTVENQAARAEQCLISI